MTNPTTMTPNSERPPMSKEIVERLREIVLKNRHHVELSPGVGEDVQRYGIAVCDDILSDIERLAEQENQRKDLADNIMHTGHTIESLNAPAAQLEPDAEISDLLRALRDYEQCDAIGVYCKVSRQAVDEAIELIERRARSVPVREEVIEIDEYGKVTNAPSRINIPRKTLQEIIAALYRKDNADSHELAAELQAMHDAATGGKHE